MPAKDKFEVHCERCNRKTVWERVVRDGKPRLRCVDCGTERRMSISN